VLNNASAPLIPAGAGTGPAGTSRRCFKSTRRFIPRGVLRFRGSEAEPDLMVRPPSQKKRTSWDKVPRPMLVVEVHSDTTRRRDRVQKKQFYAEAGVARYWMIDPEQRIATVARPGRTDHVVSDLLTWSPLGTSAPFSISLDELFA